MGEGIKWARGQGIRWVRGQDGRRDKMGEGK